jgi:hypothetical protein
VTAAANMWGVFIALAIVVPLCLLVSLVVIAIYYDSRQMEVEFHFLPRLIPWSPHAKARRARAEIALARAEEDLATVQHARLQKRMILSDLEDERLKRALEAGNED